MLDPEAELSRERMQILEMIEQGRISADEGLGLIQALNAAVNRQTRQAMGSEEQDFVSIPSEPGLDSQAMGHDGESLEGELHQGRSNFMDTRQSDSSISEPEFNSGAPAQEVSTAPEIRKWKRWWIVPLWIGVAVALFGGLFMFLAQRNSGIGLWFVCASVPLVVGIVMIVLAVQFRKAPWLHLRIQRPPGSRPERLSFSFPLPVRFGAWFLRVFGRWIPEMRDQSWDQVLLAFGEQLSSENPMFIQVDEGAGGEKVEIYIG